MTAATPSPTVANGSVATQRPSPTSGNAGEGRGPEAIVRDWMAYLGYTPEQIAAAEAENHSRCDWDGEQRNCLGEDEKSLHPGYDEMLEIDALVMFVLEHPALLGEAAEEWGVDHETFGTDGPVVSWNGAHEALARRMVAAAGSLKLVRRTVHTGPWIEVTDD